MASQSKDSGFGAKYNGTTKRMINPDGSFNIIKTGINSNIRDTYHWLINMSWFRFLSLSLVMIFCINVLFALVYVLIGVEHLEGDIEGDTLDNIIQAFYFSFQTFTTVGYGHIVPVGVFINFVAFIESTTGLMVFAIITGLLYGRFSKPGMRILFSKKALIAPYKEGWALMFRVTNLRKSDLIELEARVALSQNQAVNGNKVRKYHRLPLEINFIEFFPASWTIVHPIEETSPLHNISASMLAETQAEIIIQLKGFDQTFSQIVHTHYSYIPSEIVIGAKFKPAYSTDADGNIILPIDEFHDFENVPFAGT